MEEEIKKPNKKYSWLQFIFLILMIICIGVLIKTIITITQYAEMLKNPVGYNLEHFGIKYCTCYDDHARLIPIEALTYNSTFDKFKPQIEYREKTLADYNFNFSAIEQKNVTG